MGVPPDRSVTQAVPKKKSRQIRELLPILGPRPGALAPRDMLHGVSAISGSEIRLCVVKQYCVTHPRNACCVYVRARARGTRIITEPVTEAPL